jgi:hypothetical protein
MRHIARLRSKAVAAISNSAVAEDYRKRLQGEVFTRRWVVELILDLAGYTPEKDLADHHAVEPSCGEGAFLEPIVRRLSASCRLHGRAIKEAKSALSASDLLLDNVLSSRRLVESVLKEEGWTTKDIRGLAESWVLQQDYLLSQPSHLRLLQKGTQQQADFILGNPPYIRPEDIPPDLYRQYRESYPTMCGRADIYVAFFEAALRSLAENGVVAFICADRWMRNQYGRELRSLISSHYAMNAVISMHDVNAFEEEVSAYPAVVVISNSPKHSVPVIDANRSFGAGDVSELLNWVQSDSESTSASSFRGNRLAHWFEGSDIWPGGDPSIIQMVEELNDRLPVLEDKATGTRVGIGVATGNDAIFITTNRQLVETTRLLPLAMSADGATGTLEWSGRFLVNPWEPDGSLVDLARYPKLAEYFESHREELEGRHVAKKASRNWYRTIDKVNNELTAKPKLLFPDMKMTSHPVLDPGGTYPHHNLYFVTSEVWDLEVLGGLLMSKVAEGFISAYCVKMRGGTLRFQAQYLRRIRLPDPTKIRARDRERLRLAFRERRADLATDVAIKLYGVEHLRDVICGT